MPILNHKCKTESGFSLLEMLVVMAIMSIILAVSGSYSIEILDNISFRNKSKTAIEEIQRYRVEALLDRKDLIVVNKSINLSSWSDYKEDQVKYINVPDDWNTTGDVIRITDHGVCLGGKISIQSNNGRSEVFNLLIPTCAVNDN